MQKKSLQTDIPAGHNSDLSWVGSEMDNNKCRKERGKTVEATAMCIVQASVGAREDPVGASETVA